MQKLSLRQNWVGPLAADSKDRDHVPPQPLWTLLLRLWQMIVALVMLVLTSFAASHVGSNLSLLGLFCPLTIDCQVNGFGLTWFSFIWTVLYFVYLGVGISVYPAVYHVYAHVAIEAVANIFWLASWAVLASESSTINEIQRGFISNLSVGDRAALSCIKAAAGVGALEWLLFTVTLVFLVLGALGVDVGVRTPPASDAESGHTSGSDSEGEGEGEAPADTASSQQPEIPLERIKTNAGDGPAEDDEKGKSKDKKDKKEKKDNKGKKWWAREQREE